VAALDPDFHFIRGAGWLRRHFDKYNKLDAGEWRSIRWNACDEACFSADLRDGNGSRWISGDAFAEHSCDNGRDGKVFAVRPAFMSFFFERGIHRFDRRFARWNGSVES
jgi:hypothetical protein